MSNTVTVTIPADLHRRLEDLAESNSTTVEIELKRCLEANLVAHDNSTSRKKKGRPPKPYVLEAYDMVVDLLTFREVKKRPRGKASETITNLKRREPFRSAGDLRSRHKRFKKKLTLDPRATGFEGIVIFWPPKDKSKFTFDEVLISQLTYDEAFEIFSILKSRGDLSTRDLKNFVGARLDLIKKRPETFDAQVEAIKTELAWLLGIDEDKLGGWLADRMAGRAGKAELEAMLTEK